MKKILCALLCVFLCSCVLWQHKSKLVLISYDTAVLDNSYMEMAWRGISACGSDAEVSFLESFSQSEFEKNLKSVLSRKPTLIFAPAFSSLESVTIEAKRNPSIAFVVGDCTTATDVKNLSGIKFKCDEAAFLAGYAAARMSKSGHIGFVGGMDIEPIRQFWRGYQSGALYADKNITVEESFIGSFSDSAKGHELAARLYGGGADVVFHAAGAAGMGVIDAAVDCNAWVIGVDYDQTAAAPQNVLTSVIKKMDEASASLMHDFLSGKKIGGQTFEYGLAEKGVGLAPNNGNIPEYLHKEIERVEHKIISGEIKL